MDRACARLRAAFAEAGLSVNPPPSLTQAAFDGHLAVKSLRRGGIAAASYLSKPRSRARLTASVRLMAPRLARTARTWVFTIPSALAADFRL